jgi:hypothetical protein
MVKITKRIVEAAEAQKKDYLIWDDELPGFGLRVFSSGKRSYVIQYRTRGRSRRYTIGLHGAWAPETARREAKSQGDQREGAVLPLSRRSAGRAHPGKGRATEKAFDNHHRYWPY